MDFVKGIFTIAIIYAIGWGIFHCGYVVGNSDKKGMLRFASSRLQECNDVINHNRTARIK